MSRESRHILLVEDDRVLRRACEASLRRTGFSVTTAEDGREALDHVKADLPDLILLDLLMPRVNGLEVLRSLRADGRTKNVPVLILSNSSREQDIEEINQLDVAGYLVKSNLSLQDLCDHVTRLLGD